MSHKRILEWHGYTFKSNLGNGVYGKVVSAHSIQLKRTVAIKIVEKKKVSLAYSQKFLSREKKIMKILKHPNIVKTHEIFESHPSTVFIVMELCINGDLLKHINVRGPLPGHSSCRFFSQLCMAVEYLHNNDLAHRDIKCENLLLDKYNNLKLCDFGFSKMLTYRDGQMVLSETYCGTSSYAAPEVLRSLPYNPKISDVWSMGVVLYMMLYASMLYDSTNIKKMIDIQMQHNISFPNTPSVSSEAKDLIRGILNPDIEQRITISDILNNPWMLQESIMKDGDEAPTANTSAVQEGFTEDKKLSQQHNSDPGNLQVIGPSQPIVAIVDEDITLPCRLEPPRNASGMVLEWVRPDLSPGFVYERHNSEEYVARQQPSYRGRTSVSVDKLELGDASMKLSKVTRSDEGTYRCLFPQLGQRALIRLVVGIVSSPVISPVNISNSRVLQCEANGWYPEPELFWLDGEGNLLSAGPTETVRGPDDLYTVSRRLTVEKSDSFICRVQQKNITQIRETHFCVPGHFFPSSSLSWIWIININILLVLLVIIVTVIYFMNKGIWRAGMKSVNNGSDFPMLSDEQLGNQETSEEEMTTEQTSNNQKNLKPSNESQKSHEE
ncbi:Testis-specific serine/threonine-protein kinase 1 [Nibea albiflora]|uniref:Testis-specific serine/threonine-protein kinase 1 n=1 Tax=Nibea albiflora TaxID=240163 RepID=A0ACB7EG10_NIBAL|nr:Testis-specific serine/threonine-protein kinase 1 [Nibea albiflora]